MFLVFKCRLIDVDQMLGLDAAVFGVSYGSLVGQDLANGSKMEIYRHGDDASSANEGRLFQRVWKGGTTGPIPVRYMCPDFVSNAVCKSPAVT